MLIQHIWLINFRNRIIEFSDASYELWDNMLSYGFVRQQRLIWIMPFSLNKVESYTSFLATIPFSRHCEISRSPVDTSNNKLTSHPWSGGRKQSSISSWGSLVKQKCVSDLNDKSSFQLLILSFLIFQLDGKTPDYCLPEFHSITLD